MLNRPVVTSDGKTLFVTSASTKIYRVDAETGKKQWRDEISESTPNFYMTEPRVSLDEENVYVILVSETPSEQSPCINSKLVFILIHPIYFILFVAT